MACDLIVADALRFNWAGIEPAFAARCTVGVAIPLVVSALAGAPLAGASAAYGALVTGLATRQGVYRTRIGAALAEDLVDVLDRPGRLGIDHGEGLVEEPAAVGGAGPDDPDVLRREHRHAQRLVEIDTAAHGLAVDLGA